MKTAEERAKELLCRIYGDDWHECYDVTGHDLLTPIIVFIEAIRQEQREVCAKGAKRIVKLHLHPDNLLYDEELEASMDEIILSAGKEE
jgi:hypothetical protein